MSNQGDHHTPEQYQYFLQHSSDSRVVGILVCTTVTAFLCTLFVFLRLVGRRLIHQRWYIHISDTFLLIAWVFVASASTSFGLMTRYGGGRHVIFVASKKGLQITAMTTEVSYARSMGSLKLSVLALYRSIFPSRRFHHCLWALGFFTVSWSLMSAIGAICQCIPIESFWDDSVEGHCIQYGILQLITTVCNIITDFKILFLPIRQMQRLHASKERKRWIYFSFAMGGSACVVSVIRLVFALQVGSLDGSWDAVPAAWASEAEICAGFLVVSIPTYRPIYRKVVYGSDDALDVRTGKCYELELGSYESNNHASHKAQVSAQRILSPAQLGASVTDDIELVKRVQHNGSWVRMTPETHVQKFPIWRGTQLIVYPRDLLKSDSRVQPRKKGGKVRRRCAALAISDDMIIGFMEKHSDKSK